MGLCSGPDVEIDWASRLLALYHRCDADSRSIGRWGHAMADGALGIGRMVAVVGRDLGLRAHDTRRCTGGAATAPARSPCTGHPGSVRPRVHVGGTRWRQQVGRFADWNQYVGGNHRSEPLTRPTTRRDWLPRIRPRRRAHVAVPNKDGLRFACVSCAI
jgi:hypothetical protein